MVNPRNHARKNENILLTAHCIFCWAVSFFVWKCKQSFSKTLVLFVTHCSMDIRQSQRCDINLADKYFYRGRQRSNAKITQPRNNAKRLTLTKIWLAQNKERCSRFIESIIIYQRHIVMYEGIHTMSPLTERFFGWII